MSQTRRPCGCVLFLLCGSLAIAGATPPAVLFPEVGGDTCDEAVLTPDVPFIVEGSTVGFNNDYDEMCPYGGMGPDVVYKFMPTRDMWIDLTLCLDTTDFDTKLIIFEDYCPNYPALACVDDACVAPLYQQPYVSAISNAFVTAGHAYYIVVPAKRRKFFCGRVE